MSVVIATRNRAERLKSTLTALRCQDYAVGDEVIVVDNGSRDNTALIIQQAARDFPVPLRSLFEPTPGKGPALQLGIAAAGGSILALTDDDVAVAPDWLASIRQAFRDPALALVGGRVDPDWQCPPPPWLQVDPHSRHEIMRSPLALQDYGCDRELGARTAVGANLAIRRDVLNALGGVRPNLARREGSLFGVEDQDLCNRASQAGYRCEYRSAIRVRHWVPAERLRLSYFTRWFFWSGYGNALLGTDDPRGPDGRRQSMSWYFARRAPIAAAAALALAARGHSPAAAETAMDAAYALGYVAQRLVSRVARLRTMGLLVSALALLTPLGPSRPRDVFPSHPRQVIRVSWAGRDRGATNDRSAGLRKGRGARMVVRRAVEGAGTQRGTLVHLRIPDAAGACHPA